MCASFPSVEVRSIDLFCLRRSTLLGDAFIYIFQGFWLIRYESTIILEISYIDGQLNEIKGGYAAVEEMKIKYDNSPLHGYLLFIFIIIYSPIRMEEKNMIMIKIEDAFDASCSKS